MKKQFLMIYLEGVKRQFIRAFLLVAAFNFPRFILPYFGYQVYPSPFSWAAIVAFLATYILVIPFVENYWLKKD